MVPDSTHKVKQMDEEANALKRELDWANNHNFELSTRLDRIKAVMNDWKAVRKYGPTIEQCKLILSIIERIALEP